MTGASRNGASVGRSASCGTIAGHVSPGSTTSGIPDRAQRNSSCTSAVL